MGIMPQSPVPPTTHVTFTARNAGTLTLNLDLAPETMTVTGGEYTFEGGGRLNVSGKLTEITGDGSFCV